MARMYGGKSDFLIKGDRRNYYYVIFIGVFLFFALIGWSVLVLNNFTNFSITTQYILGISFSIIVLYIGKITKSFKIASDNFYYGRKGEGAIWCELMELSDTYVVFQDIPSQQLGNIDFAVVGPTGIFAIEVKSRGGFIRYAPEKYLKQARGEAQLLHDLIKEKTGIDRWVEPVLVYSNYFARVRFGKKLIEKVHVIQKGWLLDILTDGQGAFNENEIKKIESALIPLVKK